MEDSKDVKDSVNLTELFALTENKQLQPRTENEIMDEKLSRAFEDETKEVADKALDNAIHTVPTGSITQVILIFLKQTVWLSIRNFIGRLTYHCCRCFLRLDDDLYDSECSERCTCCSCCRRGKSTTDSSQTKKQK